MAPAFSKVCPTKLIAMAIHKLIQERVMVVVSILVDRLWLLRLCADAKLGIAGIANDIGSARFDARIRQLHGGQLLGRIPQRRINLIRGCDQEGEGVAVYQVQKTALVPLSPQRQLAEDRRFDRHVPTSPQRQDHVLRQYWSILFRDLLD